MNKLAVLDKQLEEVRRARNKALRAFRLRCKHIRLAETRDKPPYRICIDCGAMEEGWHCGYQVLVLQSERTDKVPPRSIVDKDAAPHTIKAWTDWPRYVVGQSHKNFANKWDYKSLTEIPSDLSLKGGRK